jgi:AraC family transcriptional regulator, transcriptional activator of pobA
MDDPPVVWHYSDMTSRNSPIPAWQLYGEDRVFPDVLHCERITDRAAGLDWVIAPHRHLHLHQVFLIRAGATVVEVDGRRIPLALPAVLSIPRGAVHGFRFAQGTDGFVLTVPLQELPEIFDETKGHGTRFTALISGPASPEISALFDQLFAEHQGEAALRGPMLRAIASQILCLTQRMPGAGAAADSPPPDPRFAAFEALLLAQFRNRWKVADYARAIGLSPRHLSRLCHQATGRPAERHIEAMTFREACRLLVYTRTSVASVGYHLGYDDPSYFSRAFQRHTGLSPTAYRARFDG